MPFATRKWEENGEQQQLMKGVGTVDRERSERNMTKDKTTKNTTVTMANVTPDDGDDKRRTATS